MLVLGIESTCDETGCAIVRNGEEILANVVASQHDIHTRYGGVFPELASRRHLEVIIPLIEEALSFAKVSLGDIDLIAVAHGPGLMGALLIGVNAAKTLALAFNKPLIGVNHVEAHLYAALMSQQSNLSSLPPFPYLGVILSGAHTSLVCMRALGEYELIGQTVDDAIGEAFDKVARVMGLTYPGGPIIEKLAQNGNPERFSFKPGKIKNKPFCFSFSGIKTGVLYTVKGQNGKNQDALLSNQDQADIAASFQNAAFNDVVKKAEAAAEIKSCQTLIFGGGVTNNQKLREMFAKQLSNKKLFWPSPGLSLDNAAMIAGLGYHTFKRKMEEGDGMNLQPLTRIPF